jgi:hypothetical protein
MAPAIPEAMLPPDFRTKCLRCHAALSAEDEPCKACGADPVVERQVWVQLAPAIHELRVIFLAVLAVTGIGAYLIYDELHRHGIEALPVLWPALALCGVMAVLWLAAPRAPLVCAIIGTVLFAGDWLREIARDRVFALDPGPMLAIRVIAMLALGFAVRAGLNARRMRARKVPPQAIVV